MSGAFWLLASRLLRVPLNVVIVALLARVLGPAGVGLYALVQGAAVLLHCGLLQWLQPPLVNFGRPEWQSAATIRHSYMGRLPWLALGILTSLLLLVFDPADWLGRGFQLSGDQVFLVLLAFASVWLMAEAQSLCEITGQMRALALAPLLSDALVIVLLGGLWYSGFGGGEANGIIAAVYFPPVLIWGGLGIFGLRVAGVSVVPVPRPLMRQMLAFGWPLIPGLMLAWVFEWTGPLVLARWLGQHELGVYQVALRINLVMLALSVPLSSVLVPYLLGRAQTEPNAVRQFLSECVPSWLGLWMLLILPVLAFLPEMASVLLGDKFAASVNVLGVLAVSVPGSILLTLYGAAFMVQGRLFRMTVLYYALMVVCNLALTLTLVPSLGLLGAALGMLFGYLVLQWAYVADQYVFLAVPVKAVFMLDALGVLAAGLFALCAGSAWGRIGLVCLAMSGVLQVLKYSAVWRPDAIRWLLPRPLHRLLKPLDALLCAGIGQRSA